MFFYLDYQGSNIAQVLQRPLPAVILPEVVTIKVTGNIRPDSVASQHLLHVPPCYRLLLLVNIFLHWRGVISCYFIGRRFVFLTGSLRSFSHPLPYPPHFCSKSFQVYGSSHLISAGPCLDNFGDDLELDCKEFKHLNGIYKESNWTTLG